MTTDFNNAIKYQNLLNIILSLALIFVVVLAVSCQSQEPESIPPVSSNGLPLAPTSEEPPATPPQIEVAIEGFAFNPAVLNVPVGTTVVWYNNDSVTHTVSAQDNLFDSGGLSNMATFSYTFNEVGTFDYSCKPHSYMKGKVIVE
ncbi:cupredoxin family copper-binding protein [Chloroflexota bacterium]